MFAKSQPVSEGRMKVRVFVVLVSLATLSIGAVYLFFHGATQGTLAFEAAKSLLQVGVVAVAGAVISLLTFEYQRARQVAEKEAEIKRLSDEKDRDNARQAVEKQRDVDRQATEKQRDLDRKSVEYREGLLMSTLTAAMNLNTLVSEYEKMRSRFGGERPSLALAELSVLTDFLLPAANSKFLSAVIIPYHNVQQGIRQDLLHPSLASGTSAANPNVARTIET